MSGPSSEEGFPSPKSFVKRNQWKKDRQIAENADILGVCLLGKHVPRASYRALCSGSVVRGLPEYSQKKIFVITSENIVPKEKEGDLQSEWKAFNTKDYYLYFKRLDSSNKLKTYKLHEITNSKEQVKFTSGLVIIPIDAKKLNRKSGLKTYRPFKTDKNVTDPSSLHGSVCQIVDGNTNSFDVKPYNLKYINDEYVLELPEKGYTYKNRSELTASGANSNLHAYGAIILQSSLAVGVLNFDHKISPVLFSQLPGFGKYQSSIIVVVQIFLWFEIFKPGQFLFSLVSDSLPFILITFWLLYYFKPFASIPASTSRNQKMQIVK